MGSTSSFSVETQLKVAILNPSREAILLATMTAAIPADLRPLALNPTSLVPQQATLVLLLQPTLVILLRPTPVLLLQAMASRVGTALGASIIHGSKGPHQERVEAASGPGSGQEEHLDTFLEVKGTNLTIPTSAHPATSHVPHKRPALTVGPAVLQVLEEPKEDKTNLGV